MLNTLVTNTESIYLATGATDFRKQVTGLVNIVSMQFKLDPFASSHAFIFCNRSRTSIKVLRYDQNGFVLATKKLLQGMKFQWPRDSEDVKNITYQQVEWLLQGLEIEQKKALPQVEKSLFMMKKIVSAPKDGVVQLAQYNATLSVKQIGG